MTWGGDERAIVAERAMQRARALTVVCPHCYQPAGEVCVIPKTGVELVYQPAHFQRIRAVTAGT
jgi:hypothetical protein